MIFLNNSLIHDKIYHQIDIVFAVRESWISRHRLTNHLALEFYQRCIRERNRKSAISCQALAKPNIIFCMIGLCACRKPLDDAAK